MKVGVIPIVGGSTTKKYGKIRIQNKLTICLRVIRNVWHFCYALSFAFKVICGSFGIALLTP
ncbi:hypothetical protein DOT36_16895, partial [Vibrio vulnificus]